MMLFNGITVAKDKELQLKQRIERDFSNQKLVIAAILFKEDVGSQLYTRLKREAAERVGISYQVHEFSLSDSVQVIQDKLKELNQDSNITGIIIQKPWRTTWVKAQGSGFLQEASLQSEVKSFHRERFALWWNSLTTHISESKDVDGLHPNTIRKIQAGTWLAEGRVLPATCQAVLTILDEAKTQLVSELPNEIQTIFEGTYIILGKSDLLGVPLYYELLRQKKDVELLASTELSQRMQSGQKLLDATVIISATGRRSLITGDMVSENVVVIDVGEPKPDVEFESVAPKAALITPVPGGVGPLTVISLLENCVRLAENSVGKTSN